MHVCRKKRVWKFHSVTKLAIVLMESFGINMLSFFFLWNIQAVVRGWRGGKKCAPALRNDQHKFYRFW